MIVYFNGFYVDKDAAQVNVNDRGFNFADGVYEAMVGENGITFDLDEHISRLYKSAEFIGLDTNNLPNFNKVIGELLTKNTIGDSLFFVYLQLTRGAADRNHLFPPAETPVTCFVSVKHFQFKDITDGITVLNCPDIRWKHCHIKAIGLLPNVMAREKAKQAGAEEAIFIDEQTVTEGSHTNLFVVKDTVVYTHPCGNKVLSGITRNKVVDICRNENITVQESPFDEAFMLGADEAFVTGTTTFVTPISKIISLSGENITLAVGPITDHIRKNFLNYYKQQTTP